MEGKNTTWKSFRGSWIVGWKFRYFCRDFQDYELLCAAWKLVTIAWFTEQYDTKLCIISRSSTTGISELPAYNLLWEVFLTEKADFRSWIF